MKKFLSLLIILSMILSFPAFAVDTAAGLETPEQTFASYQLSDNPEVYVDLEDPSALIGELDEDASCIMTVELDSASSGEIQPNDLHVPNIVTVKLTPGKNGFAIFVTNIGVDSLSTLHLSLKLTDYNNKFIDSHTI